MLSFQIKLQHNSFLPISNALLPLKYRFSLRNTSQEVELPLPEEVEEDTEPPVEEDLIQPPIS